MNVVQFRADDELHRKIKALAERRGVTIADLCRDVMTEAVDRGALEDSLDTLERMLIRVLRNTLKPTEDRLAKLNAKTAIAAATTMYMNTQVIANMGQDARGIYDLARKKSVNYLRATQTYEDED